MMVSIVLSRSSSSDCAVGAGAADDGIDRPVAADEEDVVAAVAVERILPRAADEGVIAQPGVDCIVAGTHGVIDGAVGEVVDGVVFAAADEAFDIAVEGIGDGQLQARVAFADGRRGAAGVGGEADDICPFAAADGVVGVDFGFALEEVVAEVADEAIPAVAAVDAVVAGAAVAVVIAVAAEDGVIAVPDAAGKRVVTGTAFKVGADGDAAEGDAVVAVPADEADSGDFAFEEACGGRAVADLDLVAAVQGDGDVVTASRTRNADEPAGDGRDRERDVKQTTTFQQFHTVAHSCSSARNARSAYRNKAKARNGRHFGIKDVRRIRETKTARKAFASRAACSRCALSSHRRGCGISASGWHRSTR
ncbi:MAG: hypothetical protein QM754_02405 [Tepidisphaeraceae bacterium]